MTRSTSVTAAGAFAIALAACGSGSLSGEAEADASATDAASSLADGGSEDGGATPVDSAGFPAFAGEAVPIPEPMRDQMIGRTWHADLDCPSLDSLSLLRMTHWGMDGEVHEGELVVASSVASEVLDAFGAMFDAGFPIERMEPTYNYDGDDDASMAANNTSAFNCRQVTGGSSLSQHSFGTAIDINPVQNPYVNGDTVLPPAGEDYLDRGDVRPGMIARPGPVTGAFAELGWGWGGDFSSLKDYQHFSENGQ